MEVYTLFTYQREVTLLVSDMTGSPKASEQEAGDKRLHAFWLTKTDSTFLKTVYVLEPTRHNTVEMVNIGQDIKNELMRQERTVSWLARKLNCNRSAVYRIFCKNSIDTALLASISKILHHNFFQDLSDSLDMDD